MKKPKQEGDPDREMVREGLPWKVVLSAAWKGGKVAGEGRLKPR